MGILDDIANWWASITSPKPEDAQWIDKSYGGSFSSSTPADDQKDDEFGGSSGGNWGGSFESSSGSDFGGSSGGSFSSSTPVEDAKQDSSPLIGGGSYSAPSTFMNAPSGSGSYWDVSSPDFDPSMSYLSPEAVAYQIMSRDIAADKDASAKYMDYFGDSYDPSRFNIDYLSKYLPWNDSGGEEIVDDGTNSYLNRSSNYITGEEARRQAEYFGNSELSDALSDVKDGEVLSKNSLRKFGYTPFLDTSDPITHLGGKISQGLSVLGDASEQVWNKVSNIRNDMSDWTVDIFGEKLSGKAVDRAIHEAHDLGTGAYDEAGTWMQSNLQLFVEDATQRRDGLWDVPASDGASYVIDADKYMSGGYTFRYQDAVVVGDDGEEYRIPMEYWPEVTKDYDVATYLAGIYNPDLSLAEMKEKADEMYKTMGSATDYGPGNINAPAYKSNDMLSEYWLPTLANGVLSSAAYLNPVTLAERSSLAGGMSAGGVNAASQRVMDNGIVSYDPSRNQGMNTAMGVLAPVAESKLGSLGNIGGKGFLERGTEAISSRIPGIGSTWAGRELIPAAVSEGLEEVITDPLYAMQESGFDAYADQAMNNEGLLAYDDLGRPIYENTDLAQRIRNYLEDQPDNFLMGAAMGGGINLAGKGYETARSRTTEEGRREIEARKADRDFFKEYVKGRGSGFTLDQVSAMRRLAELSEAVSGEKRAPMTMQEFEDMLDEMRDDSNDEEANDLEASVERNMR